jgi:PilZ domain
MSTDPNIFATIADGKPVRIFLPLLNTLERLRLNCLCRDIAPPRFSLVFSPGLLPVKEIDKQQPAIVSVDMGGPTLSLEALIEEIDGTQLLKMFLQKSISHQQLREFFRIDAVTEVVASGLRGVLPGEAPWSMPGESLDISGSGILVLFAQCPPDDKQIQLTISLPLADEQPISAIAHTVRVKHQDDGRCEVAYHFDDIAMEDRDKIIGHCLILQRKMLRLKVQVSGK